MRQIATTSKYRKDWELARRRNLPIEELNDIIFNWQTTFHYRLNRMAGAVTELSSLLLGMFKPSDCQEDTVIVDSMPIITCCGRSRTGKVARDIADKGYCSTKNLYYHGLKLHMVGYRAGAVTTGSGRDATRPMSSMLPSSPSKGLLKKKNRDARPLMTFILMPFLLSGNPLRLSSVG